jgi:hypothetical protein
MTDPIVFSPPVQIAGGAVRGVLDDGIVRYLGIP